MIKKSGFISVFFVMAFTIFSTKNAIAGNIVADEDSDNDGLTNAEEILNYFTLIYRADTDGDTLKDGYEVTIGTNPTRADTDRDGIDDADELSLGISPTSKDTDHDGVIDSSELGVLDPLNPKDAMLDFDGDGFSNRQEDLLGFDFKSNTSTPPDLGLGTWNFVGLNRVLGSPAIDSRGTIYYATESGNIYAVNPDGTQKWRYKIKGKIYGSVAIGQANNWIYVGDDKGNLTALRSNGNLRWQTETGSGIISTPSSDVFGNVYIASDSMISSYNKFGRLRWTRILKGNVSFRSNILMGDNNVLYVGDSSANLSAIDTKEGNLLWVTRLSGSLSQASPVLSKSGLIHVASAEGTLHQLDKSGKILWSYSYQNNSLSPQIYSSPTLADDGTIYIGVADNQNDRVDFSLMAVRPNGKAKWHYKMVSLPSTPAVAQDGTIYVANSKGLLHAVNRDGSMQWVNYNATSSTTHYGSPTVDRDGTIYLGSDNGALHAYVDNSKKE